MNRRGQRTRRNIVTRTYPVYAISTSELSDEDDSIIEIRPSKRHRKQPVKVKPRGLIRQPVVTDNRKQQEPQVVPQRIQKSATIQTDETTEKPLEKSKSTSKHRCLRIFALILAIFLLIISLLLLAFSLNLLLNPNMTKLRSVAIIYPQALPSSGFTGKGPTDTLLVAAIIGLVIGTILLITSILAIICLICIKYRYYAFFFCIGPVLLIILFLILIGLALFVMIAGDTELQRLASSTQKTVYYYYNSTTTTLVRDGWDFVQYYFSCCGVKTNNTDWLPPPTTGWIYSTTLPRSCCGYDPSDVGHVCRIFVATPVPALVGICYYGDIRQSTCYDNIKPNLLIGVIVFLFILAVLVIILVILFIILLFLHRTIHHRVENSIEKK